MPNPSQLASLQLPLIPGGEDPLTTIAGSTSSASGSDPCKVVSSGATKSTLAGTQPGVSSNSTQAQSTEFSLGHGFPLIPQKLVAKILKWEFVSMAELLPDNLELARRSGEAQKACSSKAPKKRELTEDWKGLVAWSVSFSTFTAIISREHPEKFQELLAYHATILIEALRFGCKGWLSYDKLFREHVEKDPSTSWSMLHPMFYSLSEPAGGGSHVPEVYGSGSWKVGMCPVHVGASCSSGAATSDPAVRCKHREAIGAAPEAVSA